MYLQNCSPNIAPGEQGVVIALALTERFLGAHSIRVGQDAALRVHGGGFAGTIQVLLPASAAARYSVFMERHLGRGVVSELEIRPVGAAAFRVGS